MSAHRYEEARTEIEHSPFQEYELFYWKSLLDLEKHRNIRRWADDVTALHLEFENSADPLHLWGAQIATRGFEAAEKLPWSFRKPYPVTELTFPGEPWPGLLPAGFWGRTIN